MRSVWDRRQIPARVSSVPPVTTSAPIEAKLRGLLERMVRDHPPAGVVARGVEVFAHLRGGIQDEEHLVYELILLGAHGSPLEPGWCSLLEKIRRTIQNELQGFGNYCASVLEPEELAHYRILSEAAYAARDSLGGVPFFEVSVSTAPNPFVCFTCSRQADCPDRERQQELVGLLRECALQRGLPGELAANLVLGCVSQEEVDEMTRLGAFD